MCSWPSASSSSTTNSAPWTSSELLARAPQRFASGAPLPTLVALLLLGGAVGKSAQLPLQTWLADAMAGPDAGLGADPRRHHGDRRRLPDRPHPRAVHCWHPDVLALVAMVGAITLLLAGFAALVQTDIKRILAYSTMSQIGYMFLALGAGAWSAAIFHLMTHAFFKALLFLSAGAVIIACHHEQNIFKMGGLRRQLPLEYACFLVGGLALCALPFVTAGFYSKDAILWSAYAAGNMHLVTAGMVGALLTSVYTFRLIFTVFHGQEQLHVHQRPGLARVVPLAILLVLSTALGGLIRLPLADVLPLSPGEDGGSGKHFVEALSAGTGIVGIALAAWLFLGRRELVNRIAATAPGRFIAHWWLNAFGFDALYDRLIVRPFRFLAREERRDGLDMTVGLLPLAVRVANRATVTPQTGRLRWYIASIALGALAMLAVVMINLH
jgi:NADH-quinone oxidoreductase subunit L